MSVIEVTTRIGCPVACRYCPQAELRDAYRRRGGPDVLSREVFRACLERIPPGVAIHFSGMGEPWSNPDCTALVLDARARGFAVMVSTTLAGMTPEDAARLQEVPITVLNIHLPSDGSGGETIRVDQDYLDLLARLLAGPLNIELRYLGERPHPRVSAMLAERNLQHVTMHTRAGNNRLEDVRAPRRWRGRLGCQRDFSQGVLLPNGEVALCCMDYGLRHVLGSLLHTGYEELFDGAAFAEIRAGRRDETRDILCRSCDAFAYRATPLSNLYYRELKPRLLKIRDRRARRGGQR